MSLTVHTQIMLHFRLISRHLWAWSIINGKNLKFWLRHPGIRCGSIFQVAFMCLSHYEEGIIKIITAHYAAIQTTLKNNVPQNGRFYIFRLYSQKHIKLQTFYEYRLQLYIYIGYNAGRKFNVIVVLQLVGLKQADHVQRFISSGPQCVPSISCQHPLADRHFTS